MAVVKSRHIPLRSCIACGQHLPKRQLTRIVRTPSGVIMVDRTGKAPGRGTYLCESPACWERGIHKGGLERGLRTTVAPQDRDQLMVSYQEHLTSPSLERQR